MTCEELVSKAQEIGVTITSEMIEKFRVYAALLKEWNERMNLTSIVEEEEVIEKHFYDSLLIASKSRFQEGNLADIGSGAGFPGMVIAICFPSMHVTLIDATKKKFLFLEEVKSRLGLTNVSFHVGRVEDMKTFREKFDFVTSRGFASLRIFVEVAAPLCKLNGLVIAMKGSKGQEELKEAGKAIEKMGLKLADKEVFSLPHDEGVRINYTFIKKERTQHRYPRPWGEIISHPL